MNVLRALLVAAGLVAGPALAIEQVYPEPTGSSSPTLSTLDGKLLARGQQSETAEDGKAILRTRYAFADGRTVTEAATFVQAPELAQQTWDWEERSAAGKVLRRFHVDFDSGVATAFKQRGRGPPRTWTETLRIVPGRTFAGAGFVPALRNLQPQLDRGEVVKLQGVGMTPRPRLVTVEVRSRGPETLRPGGRSQPAAHYTIHPDLSFLVGLLAGVPDFEFWFTRDQPPELLRAHFTLAEPGDPLVRADTHVGEGSRARRGPRP